MSDRFRHKTIVFDVGGTLLNVFRNPQQMAVEAIAHLGAISVRAYSEGVRQAIEEWRNDGGRAELEDLPETWVRHNRRALTIAGFTGDISTAAQLMEDTFLSDGWKLFDDVTSTLSVLRRHQFRMGVVSNWPATLEATLSHVGLDSYFSTIVASGVVGYAKPHSQIFQIAAELLQVEPPDVLYVGDDFEHDVIGAQAAGMTAVLLDRNGCDEMHGICIHSLTHFLELVDVRM